MKSGNQELAVAISKWVLKETGVLRIKSVKHHIVGQNAPPPEYTIMDDVVSKKKFKIKKGYIWKFFSTMKFTLKSCEIVNGSHLLAPMSSSNLCVLTHLFGPHCKIKVEAFKFCFLFKFLDGKLSANFKVPDVYGVYKFLVDYHRIGYTHLYDVQQVCIFIQF